MRIPPLEPFDDDYLTLARIVAKTSWLPNAATVHELGGAVFPTARARKLHPRLTLIMENGVAVGMYDDNATPTWALLWSHEIAGGKRKGWGLAHIWPVADDMNCYTHIANLILIPECLASLTDKCGPLTSYLRWHAMTVYGWKPDGVATPELPPSYEAIQWNYLQKAANPRACVRQRLAKLDNQRVRILRQVMERRGML